jgi:murein DD-endopeptidase MepM/ murein hydrolase activator NlpD
MIRFHEATVTFPRFASLVGSIAKVTVALILLSSCAPSVTEVTPTPVIAVETAAPQEVQLEALPPTPEPFRLTLPTPGAEPISGWRPPLYPVPWALSPYDHFYFVRPIAADEVNWPLPDYRYGGIFFAGNIVHTGVDIDAEEGAPVYAAGPGTVVWAGYGLFTESPGNESDPYGLAVAIRHDFGYKGHQLYTVYAHMSKIIAVLGQHLETGEELGLVGSTGATTGPHLHFEVRFPDNSFHNTYNPELWIAPPQGWGVLVGRITDNKDKTLQQLEVYVQSESTHETRLVKTYGGGGAINHDPYYDENLVIGDLPAGFYRLTLRYDDKEQQTWVEIFPGQVTFFTFKGAHGFDTTRPPAPIPTVTATP